MPRVHTRVVYPPMPEEASRPDELPTWSSNLRKFLSGMQFSIQAVLDDIGRWINGNAVSRLGDSMIGRLDCSAGAFTLPRFPGDPAPPQLAEIYYVGGTVDRVRVRLANSYESFALRSEVFNRRLFVSNQSVAAGATSLVVTFGTAEPDTNYAVFATPSWGAYVWVTGKSATQFTLNFSTAAPTGGGSVDVIAIRP